VRDVEIALVLAREMKAAAEREVDASLRLQQLQEVFGAERLDRGERARIQTALQMAGLEPRPSLLDADPEEPIRFALEGGAAVATEEPPPPTEAPPAQEKPAEFPTVGEFFKRRFKGRKEEEPADPVAEETVVRETLPEPESEPEPEPEAELEPEIEEEPEPEPELEPEAEAPEETEEVSTNGHVADSNGHADLDFDDVLPAHETATPADFGASAETVDFDDPRVEEELAQLAAEPEPEPEPVHFEPEEPAVAPEPMSQVRPAAFFAAAAVPVVVASFAGWAFGLAFVALGLVAIGLLRHASFRTLLIAGAIVTLASLAVSFVLAGVDGGTDDEPPAAEEPAEPADRDPQPAEPEPDPEPKAEEPASEPEPEPEAPAREEQPKAETPDDETEGLIRVPPGSEPEQSQGTDPAAPTQPGTTP
jgi:hypothetical protein